MIFLRAARVRVPCSTSNLGSGYDTLGLALERFLDATYDPVDNHELAVERAGTLARLDADAGPDLVATMFTRQLAKRGIVPNGVLRISSEIPVARGLGASSAALLAGYDLALGARGEPRDDGGAFRAALLHEGHGDNAAPSLFGGLRAVAQTPDGPVVVQLPLARTLGFAYAAPAGGVSTREARELLPAKVSHRLAAASLGRFAALLRGLAEGDRDLIRIGVKDELHVPYRLPMIPTALAAMSAASDAGAWAVTISGAGSGLIAVCDPSEAETIAAAMHEVFDADAGDPECVGFAVRPSETGLERIEPH